MSSRRYRARLRNNRKNKLINSPTVIIQNIINPRQQEEYSMFQLQLFEIVDIITQRLEISEITTQVNSLINSMSSIEDLRNLLDTIESTSISIIQNFADGTDIGIISCRISYLRTIIDNIPDGAHQEYARIGQLILDVLGMLTEGIDLSSITNKLADIESSIKSSVDFYDYVEEIKTLICSIVENIADGIDIGIISNRINYLQELISKIPQDLPRRV